MDVEKSHVYRLLLGQLDCVVTVVSLQYFRAHVVQQVGDQLQIDRVIVGGNAQLALEQMIMIERCVFGGAGCKSLCRGAGHLPRAQAAAEAFLQMAPAGGVAQTVAGTALGKPRQYLLIRRRNQRDQRELVLRGQGIDVRKAVIEFG